MRRSVVCLLVFAAGSWVSGQAPDRKPRELTELSLEELMNVEVTSVSKKEQRLAQVPAAVYVITQEDIRRSGATTIPELLRGVPGVQVARIDANKWAITTRGFSGRFSNKLLVLVDGRSVYTPAFAGVYWELQDTLLEDVERIEVIRGPGATMWGANAVNGVINIITRHARDTQGGLVVAGSGNEELGFGAVRYGGRLGPQGRYRVWAKQFSRNHLFRPDGAAAADSWHAVRGGFRSDLQLSRSDTLTIQGDASDGRAGQSLPLDALHPDPATASGDRVQMWSYNVLARWERAGRNSMLSVQAYYDRYRRNDGIARERRETADVTLEHRFKPASKHELQWGIGHRYMTDLAEDTPRTHLEPASLTDRLFSAFLQDEVTLVEDRLALTVGSKFERNDYTGLEVQPGAQLFWQMSPKHALWGSWSRSARTPSRALRMYLGEVPLPNGMTAVPALWMDRNLRSEYLRAHELGYRAQPSAHVSFDLAAFYNRYSQLAFTHTLSPIPGSRRGQIIVPVLSTYAMTGEAGGGELLARWEAARHWNLAAGYSLLKIAVRIPPGYVSTLGLAAEGRSPRHQVTIQSEAALPARLNLHTAVFYAGALPSIRVGGHARTDVALLWQATPTVELGVRVQDLFNGGYLEYVPEAMVLPSQPRRSISAKLAWRF